MRRLEATQLNPVHAEHIATSPEAQDMAVNMFSGFWSLLITFGTTIMISLFTRPKPDEEVKDLVYGLLPMPAQQKGPWYVRPGLWALVVLFVLVSVNIVFW
jgi:SSS family solute:Na+ symporter